MKHHPFGKTGLPVSGLGFGAAPIGLLETEQEKVGIILNQLLDAGVNLIDTAAAYAGSESAIGKAVGQRRDEYILVSKCGRESDDLPGKSWSREVITATIDRALRRLQTDHLDVMLLHSCDLDTLQAGDALGALVQAREAGKIRFVGYSGDNEAAAFAASLPDVAVLETSINFCDQANLDTVLPLAQEHNLGVIAKRPIANTAWRPLENLQGFYQDYARPYRERFEAMGLRAQDLGFEESDWAEIALRFTLSHSGIHTAIIGTTNPHNALRNVEAAEKGALPASALQMIRGAFARAQHESGRAWSAQT